MKILVRKLSKKRHFRKRFHSQHVKVSKVLAKSPSEQFYHVFSWFWGKLIWKMSLLGLGQILGVFVQIMSADCKYPVQYCQNLRLLIQMQKHWLPMVSILFNIARICNSWLKCNNLKKEKIFWIFCSIYGIYIKFGTFRKKKMMVIANVFPKLQTVKFLVRALSKKRRFGKRFDSQHLKFSQILAKSP